MMRIRPRSLRFRQRGQSLVETAIMLPLLLFIACNAINLAYFWYMVLTLSSIPRMGVEFSSQGGQALSLASAPSASAISDLVYENLQNTIGGTTVNTSVRVCSATVGKDSSTNVTFCTSFGPAPPTAFPANTADPEPAFFTLNRVDVAYTVTPIIPGGVFNVVLPSNMTFYRHVTMRNLY